MINIVHIMNEVNLYKCYLEPINYDPAEDNICVLYILHTWSIIYFLNGNYMQNGYKKY